MARQREIANARKIADGLDVMAFVEAVDGKMGKSRYLTRAAKALRRLTT